MLHTLSYIHGTFVLLTLYHGYDEYELLIKRKSHEYTKSTTQKNYTQIS